MLCHLSGSAPPAQTGVLLLLRCACQMYARASRFREMSMTDTRRCSLQGRRKVVHAVPVIAAVMSVAAACMRCWTCRVSSMAARGGTTSSAFAGGAASLLPPPGSWEGADAAASAQTAQPVAAAVETPQPLPQPTPRLPDIDLLSFDDAPGEQVQDSLCLLRDALCIVHLA